MGTAATTVVADATGHAEQGMQGRPGLAVRPEALGDHAEGQRMGQHLVIPGEIADRQQLDAGILLYLPVGSAQLPTDGPQACLVQLALPERFLGFFSSRSRPMRGKPRVWARAMGVPPVERSMEGFS